MAVAGVELALEREERPFLHPGRSAAIHGNGVRLGLIGELHPQVLAGWELPQAAFWALNLDRLAEAAPHTTLYEPFASFPPVREDIAVLVGENVAAAEVIAVVRDAGGPELQSVELFDVYSGEQIAPKSVSFALHLVFRAADRTLTSEEVAPARAAIVRALSERLGGSLRA
jgi:phenylalanyl-tRNA synthetase beta chain